MEDTYRSDPRLNISRLKHIGLGADVFEHRSNTPTYPTAAMLEGTLIHSLVLEPGTWTDHFYAIPEDSPWKDKRRKPWKDFKKELDVEREAANDRRPLLYPDEFNRAQEVADAVMAHPIAGAMLERQDALKEAVIYWEARGQGLKSKLDLILPGSEVVDLKTTMNLSPRRFGIDATDRQYLAQAAFYCDAWHAKTGEALPFSIIAVEKSAPYRVAVFELTEDQLEFGRRQYQGWLETFIKCQEKDEWRGLYMDERVPFEAPPWVRLPEDDAEGASVFFGRAS